MRPSCRGPADPGPPQGGPLQLQRAGAAAALAVSGPLAFHTIRRSATWTRGSTAAACSRPRAATGEIFIFDFGDPDYFAGGLPNEVLPGAQAIACNLTVTGGTSGGNLRAFPGNSDVIPWSPT